MHPAVGDQESAGDAIDRNVRQRRRQRAEQLGAVGLAVGLAGLDDADLQPLDLLQAVDQRLLRLAVSRVRSPKFWLGLLSITTAATDDSGSRSSRVNDGLASASRISASAVTRTAAPRARPSSSSTAITAMAASASQSTSEGNERGKRDTVLHALLLPQPLDQRRRVHLVGLVVSGQRIHHDVDAGAEGELALPWLAGSKRQHWLAIRA